MKRYQVWYGDRLIEEIEAESEEEASSMMADLTLVEDEEFED